MNRQREVSFLLTHNMVYKVITDVIYGLLMDHGKA